MDKSTIIARLREHEGELKAAGIEHLFLHGSYARGTAVRDVSDVDVIADSLPDGVFRFWIWWPLKTASQICWVSRSTFPRQNGSRSQLPPRPRARPYLPFREPALSLRINQAVQHFVACQTSAALRSRLELGAVRDRDLDSEVAAEWLDADQQAGRQLDSAEAGRKAATPGAAKSTSRRSTRR
jgi:hypothetical protein